MLKKLKYVKIKDILGIFIFIIMIIPSLILKIFKNNIWLVSELADTCRDNGYHFFKYMSDKHPEIDCYYVIDKKCDDYKNISNYKNVIQYGSLKHWLYYMSAKVIAVTDKSSNPDHPLFSVLHLYLNLYNNVTFLQHGVIKDDIPMFYYKNTKFKNFICGAKREYDYILEKYGYPKENVAYTGLARFDNLNDAKPIKNQILIMPTWRNWLGRETNFLGDKINFEETTYYKEWNGLLNNSEFCSYLEKNNLNVKFYPHHQMQKYLSYFNSECKNIEIVDPSKYSVQTLLKESALLITDFSSVYMDFSYMQKPVIYYQFDIDEYREKQLQQGYFDYIDDGFGPVVYNQGTLLNELKKFNLIFYPDSLYLDRMKKFFSKKDCNNCERIYEQIIKNGVGKHENN